MVRKNVSSFIIILFSLAIISTISISCLNMENNSNKKEKKIIDSLLQTNKVCNIIKANFLIGELKDTTYIDTLFKNINDVRICPGDIRIKGQSVYQSKVIALRKITNKDSMLHITRKPDTLIINYFKHFFRK